ncbi:ArsR/SmtB family transcription factor [Aquisediminimonas profunda]|uniref:ArsR/SmtB family transcription factor n=1 Tax=Aquisediminimonas profunda TaxID=1550733 RepID=UPI001C62F078|nr:metalloregulator ArsR/SmtB family transcription factor [Aquisediminimonas profunda]
MPVALDIFRALADPTRLRIIALLRRMELSIGEIAQVLGQSQPRVSRHVKILCDAGLAIRRKEGSWAFLAPGAPELVDPLFRALDIWQTDERENHWIVADKARLSAVHADRAAAAERYFAAHAAQWDAIRSLHVAESEVEAAMAAALAEAPIGRLVDVGTGTGRMIELFGSAAQKAVGIDRSPEMLRLARAKLSAKDLPAWELRQGDLAALPVPDGNADTVILHQVLHFIPDPESAIGELARIISPKGRLLIVDFAPHDREELRDRDAHARLGFSDEQIAGWFEAAGLECDLIENLKGGRLTVKLWRGRKRQESRLKVIAA